MTTTSSSSITGFIWVVALLQREAAAAARRGQAPPPPVPPGAPPVPPPLQPLWRDPAAMALAVMASVKACQSTNQWGKVGRRWVLAAAPVLPNLQGRQSRVVLGAAAAVVCLQCMQ
jgi:hypothetical protein